MTAATDTLVLDADYSAHRIVDWSAAVQLIYKGRAEIVEVYDLVMRRVSRSIVRTLKISKQMLAWFELGASDDDPETLIVRMPSVIRLLTKVGRKTSVKFSRKNVVTRDGFRCQYCGKRKRLKALNFDHVIPRSQGGKTTWDNIVMSCYDCNSQKRDRTPEQAGMRLLKEPVRPRSLAIEDINFDELGVIPASWRSWLYWNVELEP